MKYYKGFNAEMASILAPYRQYAIDTIYEASGEKINHWIYFTDSACKLITYYPFPDNKYAYITPLSDVIDTGAGLVAKIIMIEGIINPIFLIDEVIKEDSFGSYLINFLKLNLDSYSLEKVKNALFNTKFGKEHYLKFMDNVCDITPIICLKD